MLSEVSAALNSTDNQSLTTECSQMNQALTSSYSLYFKTHASSKSSNRGIYTKLYLKKKSPMASLCDFLPMCSVT